MSRGDGPLQVRTAVLHRRTPVRHLLGPAVLAALFGLSAILSGLGNPEGKPTTHLFFEIIAYNLAWPTPWTILRGPPVAIVVIGMLCFGLWRQKFMLGALLALLLAFSIGSAVFYGQSPWHSAFLMMTVFMGFMLSESGIAYRLITQVCATPSLPSPARRTNAGAP